MTKTLKGTVVSINMKDTIIVEVSRRTPHPLYKKLLTRSKKFKVGANGLQAAVGDYVQIAESKPVSRDKHFILLTIITPVKEVKHG